MRTRRHQKTRIFFSVGEPSGDLHGANLINELQKRCPGVQCIGLGGPRMAAAGCEILYDLTSLAVMWFLRVLINLHRFIGVLRLADRYFRTQRPDAVVLIDYPGLNWWIARRAKAHGIPVFYYGTPQLWAWAGWRVRKMRRLTDHILCKLPFEPDWFRRRDCHATYVGHPYFDELATRQLDSRAVTSVLPARPQVVILPGSRTQEVTQNLPMFLAAAQKITQQIDEVTFAIASYDEAQAELARKMLAVYDLPVKILVGHTAELIQQADCCIACSGSVSLELLYHETPTVIGYRVGRFAYWLQNKLRTVKYITLTNLLDVTERCGDDVIFCQAGENSTFNAAAEDAIYPEFVAYTDKSDEIAGKVVQWLQNEEQRQTIVRRLSDLRRLYAKPGASARAADYIWRHLPERTKQLPPPQFTSERPPSVRAAG